MSADIHTVHLGISNGYIIKDKGTIMIDCGCPKKGKKFIECANKYSIQPGDISLIIITHGHWDHTGSAREIKDLTAAKIAMHRNEKDWLENELKYLPPGVTPWGRFFAGAMNLLMPFIHVPAADVDITLGKEDFLLTDFGILGKIIHTPGHSSGSVSVLLDTGEVFVGDMAMDTLPLQRTPGLSDFAEDLELMKESWRKLLKLGAKKIYPAHGAPFSSDIISGLL